VAAAAEPVPSVSPYLVLSRDESAPAAADPSGPVQQTAYPAPPAGEAVAVAELPAIPLPRPESLARPAQEVPLIAALRCFLDNRPGDAIAYLDHYDKPNQEVLLGVLPFLVRLTEQSLTQVSPREVAEIVNQLDTLQGPLEPHAELTIEKLCFCSAIDRFGVYQRLPDDRAFRPGEWVQIYVEPKHFSSELRDDGFETNLSCTLVLRECAGKREVVWQDDHQPARPETDVSQTRRHDYFINYPLRIPPVAPGLYTLWVRVTDVPTKRWAQRSLDLRVSTLPNRGP
jgi:hypothetical protein